MELVNFTKKEKVIMFVNMASMDLSSNKANKTIIKDK